MEMCYVNMVNVNMFKRNQTKLKQYVQVTCFIALTQYLAFQVGIFLSHYIT